MTDALTVSSFSRSASQPSQARTLRNRRRFPLQTIVCSYSTYEAYQPLSNNRSYRIRPFVEVPRPRRVPKSSTKVQAAQLMNLDDSETSSPLSRRRSLSDSPSNRCRVDNRTNGRRRKHLRRIHFVQKHISQVAETPCVRYK